MKILKRSLNDWGVFLGPIVGIVVFALLPEVYGAGVEFSLEGRLSAGVAAWMAVWWLSEAVPIPVTALIPLAVFPLLGVATIGQAAAPYANDVIYLFLGGFILSIAMQRWNLHKRLALFTLRLFGVVPARMVLGFMTVTAVLSMWVSNTATAVMMLPIAMSVLAMLESEENRPLEMALLLGIAYAASIGGIGTIIGTPPNVFLISFLESSLGVQISFIKWMAIGIPLVLVMLPSAWLLLTRYLYKLSPKPIEGAAAAMQREYESLGKMSRAELTVMIVFFATALAWIFRPLIPVEGLSDAGIAMVSAVAFFVLPNGEKEGGRIMDWAMMSQVPWGILILFGGGLSLAATIERNQVGEFLGYQASLLGGVPLILMIFAVVAVVVFLTELTSNTATTATLLPILAGVAIGADIPVMMLLIPTAISASCAFMMPVATPPNAVVFGSGRLTIKEMTQAGFWLNIIAIAVITLMAYFLIPIVFG